MYMYICVYNCVCINMTRDSEIPRIARAAAGAHEQVPDHPNP